MADVSRLADISGIQSYVINGSKVLFLRRRPQPRPPKGAVGASQCTICSRHLQDVNLYCSLQCKLDSNAGIKHVSLRAIPINETRSTGSGPETPSHLLSLKPVDTSSDSDSGYVIDAFLVLNTHITFISVNPWVDLAHKCRVLRCLTAQYSNSNHYISFFALQGRKSTCQTTQRVPPQVTVAVMLGIQHQTVSCQTNTERDWHFITLCTVFVIFMYFYYFSRFLDV